MIEQFDALARDYAFDTIDATRGVDEIHEYLWGKVAELVRNDAGDPALSLVRP